ncbi:MAG: GGDEF domain-containing protein [Paracoccaceae bacterium]|nr:GGDEF domain-containing protein [Paracoccaceae bacterium]
MTGAPAMIRPMSLSMAALAQLMPMYLWLSLTGVILAAGPTLCKVLGRDPAGQGLPDHFLIRRPADLLPGGDFTRLSGCRVQMQLRHPPATLLRGLAVPLEDGAGLLFNLSFGIGVAEAVRIHALTDSDFAPTDLAVEMLYMAEANSAVMQELHGLNRRLQRAKAAAEQQALTDTLTGLANRRAMEQAVDRLLQTGTDFGLAQVDLDFFKQVNDTLGHAAGDHVLHEVARVLCDETRTGDVVARVGGDEFVLIFPGVSRMEGIAAIAERIIDRLSRPIGYAGRECRISASIGMTLSRLYPQPRLDRMLGDADRALYLSKMHGRGRATAFSRNMATDPEPPAIVSGGAGPDAQPVTLGTLSTLEAKKP